jgi:AcrR family transcriptional regulator
LHDAVIKSGLSITQIAKRAGYSRSSYYNHVEDPKLPYHILQDYGKALRINFSDIFPEMQGQIMEDNEEAYGEPKTLGQALVQRDNWKEKYYQLLEKYQKLLESRLR